MSRVPLLDRLLVGSLIALLLLYGYRHVSFARRSSSSSLSSSSSSLYVEEALVDYELGREPVALASIAVGPKARFSAKTLLQSFVRKSRFKGAFYVVTDSPSYFDDLQKDLDEHPETRVVYVRINDRMIGDMPLPLLPLSAIFKINRYGQTQWQRFSDFKRKRLEIKWLKTRLFEFIPRHPYVIFMDADMLIGQDLSPFVEHCIRKQRTPAGRSAIVTLFTDIGNTASLYHTGVIWLSRQHSQPLLDKWGSTIRQGIFPSDQRAIEHSVNYLDVADRVSFIDIDDATRFFAFINGTCVERGVPYTFMHTTSYRLASGEKFGFTNATLAAHFKQAYDTDWQPWVGSSSMSFADQVQQLKQKIQLQKEEVARQEAVPFKRPTVIQLRKDVLAQMEAELAQLLVSKGKAQFNKDFGGGGGGEGAPAADEDADEDLE
jgi:hypothetical protein